MNTNLSNGKLLVADPSIIGDFSFTRAVILLADHNNEGSVGFMFERKGEIIFSSEVGDDDTVMMAGIEAGAEDDAPPPASPSLPLGWPTATVEGTGMRVRTG